MKWLSTLLWLNSSVSYQNEHLILYHTDSYTLRGSLHHCEQIRKFKLLSKDMDSSITYFSTWLSCATEDLFYSVSLTCLSLTSLARSLAMETRMFSCWWYFHNFNQENIASPTQQTHRVHAPNCKGEGSNYQFLIVNFFFLIKEN